MLAWSENNNIHITKNDSHNTVYQPQQVHKKIWDESKNKFISDTLRVSIWTSLRLNENRNLE